MKHLLVETGQYGSHDGELVLGEYLRVRGIEGDLILVTKVDVQTVIRAALDQVPEEAVRRS